MSEPKYTSSAKPIATNTSMEEIRRIMHGLENERNDDKLIDELEDWQKKLLSMSMNPAIRLDSKYVRAPYFQPRTEPFLYQLAPLIMRPRSIRYLDGVFVNRRPWWRRFSIELSYRIEEQFLKLGIGTYPFPRWDE